LDFNNDLGVDRSYYVSTANPWAPAPALAGAVEADLVVVGGGCTGLAAAYFAAKRGLSVVLVEAGRIGWGASGRNGGQMIPGLRKGASDLVRLYGVERARTLFGIAVEGRGLMLDLIRQHKIACDLKTQGHLVGALKQSDLAWMRDEVACLADVMNYPHARLLDRDQVRQHLRTDAYRGGLLDEWGGHVHPLNYALGLAEAARAAGVTLYEGSPAIRISSGAGVSIETPGGTIEARQGVLAGDALLGDLEPAIAGRIMPVANYIIATEPLAENPIPLDVAASDSRFVVNYYRMSADGRLLFGGGERYSPSAPADIKAFVRPYMLGVFPQLANARIEHGWGGVVSVTTSRLPHVGRTGNFLYAHGYSGQGVILTTLAGKLLAEAAAGIQDRFDIFARIAPPAFPGGTKFRHPLYVLGMLWYALRDRL
jgi:gamma-glutamylputrescine oxidase